MIELKFPLDFIIKVGLLPVIFLLFLSASLFFFAKTITPKNPTPLQAHWKSNANWGTALILLMALIWGLVAVPKMITDKILIGDEIIEFEDLTVEFENVCELSVFFNDEDEKLYWEFLLHNGNSEIIFENNLIEIHKKELLHKFVEKGMYVADDGLSLKRDSC